MIIIGFKIVAGAGAGAMNVCAKSKFNSLNAPAFPNGNPKSRTNTPRWCGWRNGRIHKDETHKEWIGRERKHKAQLTTRTWNKSKGFWNPPDVLCAIVSAFVCAFLFFLSFSFLRVFVFGENSAHTTHTHMHLSTYARTVLKTQCVPKLKPTVFVSTLAKTNKRINEAQVQKCSKSDNPVPRTWIWWKSYKFDAGKRERPNQRKPVSSHSVVIFGKIENFHLCVVRCALFGARERSIRTQTPSIWKRLSSPSQ